MQYWRNTCRLDHIYRDPHNGDQMRMRLHYGDIGGAFETRPPWMQPSAPQVRKRM